MTSRDRISRAAGDTRALATLRRGGTVAESAKVAGIKVKTLREKRFFKDFIRNEAVTGETFRDTDGRTWSTSYVIAHKYGIGPSAVRWKARKYQVDTRYRYGKDGYRRAFYDEESYAQLGGLSRSEHVVAIAERLKSLGYGEKPQGLSKQLWVTLAALAVTMRDYHGFTPSASVLAQVLSRWGVKRARLIRHHLRKLEELGYIEINAVLIEKRYVHVITLLKGPHKLLHQTVRCPCGCGYMFDIPYPWCAPSLNGNSNGTTH